MKKVLLHTCCAPCSIYPIETLRDEGFDVAGFWYNPNVHPFEEYRRRLDALFRYAHMVDLPIIADEAYKLEHFLTKILQHMDDRCPYCYAMRLDRTAARAASDGFDAFSTTLLYSRHMKHDALIEQAQIAAANHQVEFLYRDFREGWHDGISKSKAMGIYRQPYCGCIFSERDRYAPKR